MGVLELQTFLLFQTQAGRCAIIVHMDEHDDDVAPEVEDGVDFEVEDFSILTDEDDEADIEDEEDEPEPDIDPDKSEI